MNKFEKLLETLKSNEQLAKELVDLTPSDASKKLNDLGLDISEKELTQLAKDLEERKKLEENNETLSDEELAKVAGGKNYDSPGAGYYGVVGGLLTVLGTLCVIGGIPW